MPGKDFGELVREGRQRFNLPVRQCEKILLFRPASAEADQPVPEELDQEPEGQYERAWWHMEMAERRMREVLDLLDQARQMRASREHLVELEAAYQHEVSDRDAALRILADDGP